MVLVFDLDDTLYDELTYVRSGFKAVAEHLRNEYGAGSKAMLARMLKLLEGGRGRIFDDALEAAGIKPTRRRVSECVTIYRSHLPVIRLSAEADRCLRRLRHLPLYIVTDGNKLAQSRKVEALGLRERTRFVYITHRYGKRHAKPSPHCFLRICERERVSPDQVVYIADNANKDFVGIRPLGFRTIRVRTGQYRDLVKPARYRAEHEIDSLGELTPEFLEDFFRRSPASGIRHP